MNQRAWLLFGTGSLFLSALVFGKQGNVTIERVPVTDSISVLFGQGGNIGVCAGDDGVFLIDDQFAPLAPQIEAALDEISDGPLRFLLNTHWHGDHSGGNAHFGREATILAHENVRRRLAGDASIGGNVTPAGESAPSSLPVVTFEEGISLHLNGQRVDLVHYANGHTDGDTVAFFPDAKVAHMGDLFFESQYPYVDVSSGGSTLGVLAALEAVLARVGDDWKIIPGHGRVSDRETLAGYREMIEEVVARVREAVAIGDDPATMLANGLLDDFNERWGNGSFMTPQRFLTYLTAEFSE